MKIRFLVDRIYETEGRNKGPKYLAGQVVDLPTDLAERWLRRQVAELVEESNEVVKEAVSPASNPAPEPSKVATEPVKESVSTEAKNDKPVATEVKAVPKTVAPVLKTAK